MSPTQQVPWHYHTNIKDTFYVLDGNVRIILRDPDEQIELRPGESWDQSAQGVRIWSPTAAAEAPHSSCCKG